MPHIHTEPNQHDLTVSAYIVRRVNNEYALLLHEHKKMKKLLQPGGHVELHENPWDALTHELMEETGYEMNQLAVLQPARPAITLANPRSVQHPVPFIMNTHPYELTTDAAEHFHTDMTYLFYTEEEPLHLPGEGESTILVWLTKDQLAALPVGEVSSNSKVVGAVALEVVEQGLWTPAPEYTL